MLRRTLLYSAAIALVVLMTFLSTLGASDSWLEIRKDPSNKKELIIRVVSGTRFPKADRVEKIDSFQDALLERNGLIEPLSGFEKDPTVLGRVPGGIEFLVFVTAQTLENEYSRAEARTYLTAELGLTTDTIDPILARSGERIHESRSQTLKAIYLPLAPRRLIGDGGGRLPLEILFGRYEQRANGVMVVGFWLSKDASRFPGAYVRVVGPTGKTVLLRGDASGSAGTTVVPGPMLISLIDLVHADENGLQTRATNLVIHVPTR